MLRNKRRKSSLAFVAVLLIASVAFSLNLKSVRGADEEPVVYVDPPEVLGLPVSATFTISVKVANVTDLYGFDLQLKWDPSVIGYVSHTVEVPVETHPGGLLHSPVMQLIEVIDESDAIPGAEPGTMAWVGYSSRSPAAGFTGSGNAFKITFRVKSVGRSWIEFVASALSNSVGVPITHSTRDGFFNNAPPPSPVDISVNPPSIVDSTLTPCHYFSVNVMVEDVVRLYSFEFWMDYNTTILDVNSVTVNPAFPPAQVHVEVLEAQGKIRVNASLTSPPGINGDLSLATIEFHVTDIGGTVLDLHDITMTNEYEENIPIRTTRDGYFNNVLVTKIFINPPELIVPEMTPGDTFTIDVQIENAIDMYDYEFKLWYDTDILTCLGAIIFPPNDDTHFTVEMSLNDTEGVFWVKVQYYPPAEPFTILAAKTMTRITFMMQAFGQTVLDLYDTKISDFEGNNKPHEVGDGFFASLLRDVAITRVNVTSSNKVYPGRVVTIEVWAMNRGNMTVETFDVTVYYDDNPIETRTITVNPWTVMKMIFYWNTSGLTPCNNFTIWARASEIPYETNLDNNVFYDGWVKIKMPGDINGDGVIDIYDAVLLLTAYGTHEGDPDYNPEADIAPPWGWINLYDAVTLCFRYGWHCP